MNKMFPIAEISPFKVPDRGSVNPSPLGEWDAILSGCKTISGAVTRYGTANTIWFGSPSTDIRFWLGMSAKGRANCCGRLRGRMKWRSMLGQSTGIMCIC